MPQVITHGDWDTPRILLMSLWSPLPAAHQQSSSAKLKGGLFVFTIIEEGMGKVFVQKGNQLGGEQILKFLLVDVFAGKL